MAERKPKPIAQTVARPPSWQASESTYIVGRSHLDGVDALAHDFERKWGVGRLRLLVDNDLRARFDSQRLKLNRAINGGDLEDIRRESERMTNAWQALNEEAEKTGAERLSSVVWEIARPDGRTVALVADLAQASHVRADGRYVDVYTSSEIGEMIAGFPELIAKSRVTFPGAEIVRVAPIRDPLDEIHGDEIPF